MTKFKVTYPLITTDGSRDFETREEAEKFARERREICESAANIGRGFYTRHSVNRVRVQEVGV